MFESLFWYRYNPYKWNILAEKRNIRIFIEIAVKAIIPRTTECQNNLIFANKCVSIAFNLLNISKLHLQLVNLDSSML